MSSEGGLMIDLSPMKGIHADAARRTVCAQGGVLWQELNRETPLHGLATTGGVVGRTGIAGLTLGGGLGWLRPRYGLALELSGEAIRTLIAGVHQCPSPMRLIVIEHFHGAASRVPVAATACPLRVAGFNVVIASQRRAAKDTERDIRWARETFAALTPFLASTPYVDYLDDDAADAAATANGPNLPRLIEIKTKCDPENFFRQDVNIPPAANVR